MEDHTEVISRVAGSAVLATLVFAASAWADELVPSGAKAGDLIFREGTELVSAAVLAVDRGTFSHVGMLVGRPGQWKVAHATPSEVPGRPDSVVLDDLAFFLDPKRSRRHAVFRVLQVTNHQRDEAVRAALKQIGRPFSMDTSEGTYCTTYVWQSWMDAGKSLEVSFTRLHIPLMQGEYLMPGVLAKSIHLSQIQAGSILRAQ